jgi:hypothetical protein
MDVAEVRRRLRGAIESARREAGDRRGRSDAAARDYEAFLAERAVPTFQQLASALTSEGHPFKIFTPAGSVRLASDRSGEEFIELFLDTSQDPPQVSGRSSRGRGRRMIASERPVREGAAISDLTEDDVLTFLIAEIVPFLE